MSGHWERDGVEFYDLDDMWEYIQGHEQYFDEVGFERWLNDHFTAAQMVWRSEEDYVKHFEGLWVTMMEEFEDDEWSSDAQVSLEEGYDYYYGPSGEYEFKWIEDEEEE